MQKGGWSKVSYIKHSPLRWDTFLFSGRNQNSSILNKDITFMYISEFPEGSSAKDLFDLFRCIGSMLEVEISPRRNKFGKRSGLAGFVDVSDGRLLVVWLDNTIITGKKIHVNLPRFQRGHFEGVGRFGGMDKGNIGWDKERVVVKGKERVWFETRRKGISYAEAVVSIS